MQQRIVLTLPQLRSMVAEAELLQGKNVIENGPDAKPVASVVVVSAEQPRDSFVVASYADTGIVVALDKNGEVS